MSDQSQNEEKKIIADEDWKSRVEAEKKAVKPTEAEPASDQEPPLPPPGLNYLASTFYLQGMVLLGLMPNPASKKTEVRLDHAQHVIDTLQVLYEKTEGNRTSEETADLDAMLHELRLAYLGVQEHRNKAAEEKK